MRLPRRGKKLIALGLLGVVLLASLSASEYLLLPLALEPVGRYVYRAAFFVTFPFRVAVLPFLPQESHHWSLTHTAVVSLGTPFFLYLLAGAARLIEYPFKKLRALSRRGRPPSAGVIAPRKGMGRREFLGWTGTGAVAIGSLGYCGFIEPGLLRVREYEIPIANLPSALDGLRLAHLSDTHYGPFISLRHLARAVARVNALRPDLVALTGDYVHRSSAAIEPGIGVFRALRSRFGTVAVLGNHEHWEGAQASRDALHAAGALVLDNTRVFLSESGLSAAPPREPALCVAGVGDLWEDVVLFDRALEGAAADMPRIVLSHNPDTAEHVGSERRVDLMLAGHTHGGQVVLPRIGPLVHVSLYGDRYLGGCCKGPFCPVIVSRGVGLAGLPLRFRVPPEIGVVTLRARSRA